MTTLIAVDFKKSAAADEARDLRRIVRRADLTKGHRDVLMATLNMWLYHRGGPKGMIHPGRELIAKRAKVSVATVKRAFALFREMGIMVVMRYPKGGTLATRYTLDTLQLRRRFDPSGVKEMAGELVRFTGQNDPVQNTRNDPVTPGQNEPRSIETLRPANFPCQEGEQS